MPVSLNNTQVVFNNGTTQTTAPVNTNANVNSVSAGTGISVNATTGALTVSNTGVTSVNGQTGAVTVSSSSGTVTSVATGNGLQGGTITSSGTLSLGNVNFNTVGAYVLASGANNINGTGGDTVAGGLLNQACAVVSNNEPPYVLNWGQTGFALSGTYRAMGFAPGASYGGAIVALFVRIA